ncbi:MAG: polymer-forming cytoskeletal protein, partial [Psychromonas sp.]|nr:polymer-forming cytoskeletal protein [Psychromonas sp.]
MKKSQNGFVLVSVLLITTISTVYAFNEIKGNQLQERIGGNQQKEMNARMLAEKGVFDTFSYIQGQNIGNVSHATITHAINDGANNDPGKIRVYSASVDTDGKFSFYSQGTHNGAQAFMNAIVEVEKEHIWYPDATGVVGCDGVNLESGIINSYNSTTEPGQYSEATSGNKGNVATINATGDVTLGSGIVNGSVTSNGKVETTNSTTINGDVTAQKNIDLSQGVNITGNLHSGKDSNIDGGKIVGNVNAVGNVTHGSGVGEVQGDVKYGKNFGLLNSDNEVVQST